MSAVKYKEGLNRQYKGETTAGQQEQQEPWHGKHQPLHLFHLGSVLSRYSPFFSTCQETCCLQLLETIPLKMHTLRKK